jgi:hypothetical protein
MQNNPENLNDTLLKNCITILNQARRPCIAIHADNPHIPQLPYQLLDEMGPILAPRPFPIIIARYGFSLANPDLIRSRLPEREWILVMALESLVGQAFCIENGIDPSPRFLRLNTIYSGKDLNTHGPTKSPA